MVNFNFTSGERPQKSPLQYKQIDCLLNPSTTISWTDIVNKNPKLESLFKSNGSHPDNHTVSNKPHKIDSREQKLVTESRLIPWSKPVNLIPKIENISSEPLNSFTYDCSYVSPAIKNIYSRELSEQGWYRWVGPEPCLIINLPINYQLSDQWIFSIAFHSFINDIDSANLSLVINDVNTRLDWLLESSYKAIITSSMLNSSENNGTQIVKIQVSIPQAYPSSIGDSRRLAFAIRTFSFLPLNLP